MVTQELLNYIKTQRRQGVTNELVKENLLNNNWAIQEIDQAFAQLGIQQQPQFSSTFQPATPEFSQTAVLVQNGINQSSMEKPKIIKTISALIFLIASLYTFGSLNILGIILVIERSMSAEDLIFSLLKYYPTFGIIPIVFSIISLFFFYLAIKIRNGSKFVLKLAISSLLFIPIAAAFFSQMMLSPFQKMTNGFNDVGAEVSAPYSPTNLSTIRFGDAILVLAVVGIILLTLSRKKFYFDNDSVSSKAKVFLALVTVILVVPTISIIALDFVESQDTDFGHSGAETTTGYHIYKPSSVPDGLTYATKFSIGKELAGKQTAVLVVFDVPFDVISNGGQAKSIVVKQVGVEDGFDISSFAATFVENATPQKISLSQAANQTGFLMQKPFGESTLNAVVFLTSDNMLITLISPRAEVENLIKLAESLE